MSGLAHKIDDPGSPVKGAFKKQTDTIQFKRWFGKSKTVEMDGAPLHLFHGTPNGGVERHGVQAATVTEVLKNKMRFKPYGLTSPGE